MRCNNVLCRMVYSPHLPTQSEFLTILSARQQDIDRLNQSLAVSRFGVERYGSDSRKLKFYCGFTSYVLLVAFFNWLKPAVLKMAYPYSRTVATSRGVERSLALCDELFLTLCRLHAGLLEEDLADRFNVSLATVSRILLGWINLLYFVLGSINIWPSRECVDRFTPAEMRSCDDSRSFNRSFSVQISEGTFLLRAH